MSRVPCLPGRWADWRRMLPPLAMLMLPGEAKRKGLPLSDDAVANFVLLLVLGGIVGACLYYVAFNWNYYGANPSQIPAVWWGGLAIHGGLIGGLLAGVWFARRHQIPLWRLGDTIAPNLILGQALGRFGNFMNGDAHGVPTDLPWGMMFAWRRRRAPSLAPPPCIR